MNSEPPPVRVINVAALSPSTEAIYEVGKKMLADSIDVGRDFSKFMISLASGGIPIYVGLLGLLGAKEFTSLAFYAPPALLVASVVLFVIAYFPRYGRYSLEISEEIEAARTRAVQGRNGLLRAGLAVFLVAVALSAGIILHATSQLKGIKYHVEVIQVDIPRNATVQEVESSLKTFLQRVNKTQRLESVELKTIGLGQSTIVLATVKTSEN